jgi:hypothetical protein
MADKYLSTGDAGRLLGVTSEELRRKCVLGRIPGAFQIEPGRGWWRIPRAWVDEVLSATRPVVRRREAERE